MADRVLCSGPYGMPLAKCTPRTPIIVIIFVMETTEPKSNFIREIIDADLAAGKNEKRVHTRFPPEPNGYLHIGHAKSICLNSGLARDYKGKFNLRFDDTNPSKEEQEYVDSIIEDVKWLGGDFEDRLLFASDYFQQMYDWAMKLVKDGKAYVCDLNAEEVRKHRGTPSEPGKDSPFRNRSIEENVDLFERMKKGEFPDGTRTLRAKIDMAHPNLNLRDPVMYRILHAEHHRQGNKWCVYPMYDWAHGLEDSIEKITHSICTLEFADHRPLYDWFLDALGVYHPQQLEFARLNLSNTVLSKRKLLELVTSGKPLKTFVLRPSFFTGVAETGRAAALRSASDIELLFLSLRNVYFLQNSMAGPNGLAEPIGRGLRSPRPAVFSILTDNGRQERASEALLSRAFPHFVYDPDRASDFVSCLDLGENTAPDEMWPKASLEYVSEDGKTQYLERPFTFADFAVNEKEFQEQFSPVPANLAESTLVPLVDYLGMTPVGRLGKTPFIFHRNQEKHLVKLVPSQAMVARTADKLHLWHTLQELGGIKNPFVQAAEQRLKEQLTAEREKSLSEQKAQLESQLQTRESEAVAVAMRNLALRLTGMSAATPAMAAPAPALQAPAKALSEAPAAAPKPAVAAPKAEPVAAPVSELPWIEEKLCTTCDEGTNINKKIFAYNGNKKAYILNPRGGPYRDIVRAAEKCSSGAIHPGLPQDPNEKDLDKLIKRAERFQ